MTLRHHCRNDIGFARVGAFGGVDEGGYGPVAQNQNPVRKSDELGKIVRDQQYRGAFRDDFPHQRVDVFLGADVEPAAGIVEHQDMRAARQPFGEDDLLLVASRQRAAKRAMARRANPQPRHPVNGERPAAARR